MDWAPACKPTGRSFGSRSWLVPGVRARSWLRVAADRCISHTLMFLSFSLKINAVFVSSFSLPACRETSGPVADTLHSSVAGVFADSLGCSLWTVLSSIDGAVCPLPVFPLLTAFSVRQLSLPVWPRVSRGFGACSLSVKLRTFPSTPSLMRVYRERVLNIFGCFFFIN